MQPLVSLVIPAFNEAKSISKTLQAVFAQHASFQYEVIVVDNNSTDDTVKIAQGFPTKIVHSEKKGITVTRLVGAEHSKGEIIVQLDADTVPLQGWLESLVSPFLENESVSLTFGPSRYFANTPTRLKLFLSFNNFLRSITSNKPWMVAGYNLAFRKKLSSKLKHHGYELSVSKYEDTLFAWRLGKLGKVQFVKNAVVETSSRRLEKHGLIFTISNWLHFMTHVIFKKEFPEWVKNHEYPAVR